VKNSPQTEHKVIQPFLKWAGNKRSIIDRITHLLPEGDRLIEPFCGSAAVFLNTNYKDSLICDTNSDLINLYHHLQKDNVEFINYCEKYFITNNNTPEKYYEFRERFNKTKSKRLRAALFLYLNKHGYNGLCRYNKSGKFNVPVGKYKKVTLPRERMEIFASKTVNAEFLLSDYTTTMRNAKKGDVIYCDPPYVPLNESNSSFQYEKNGFSMEQQAHLAILAEETANRGIPVLISNHLTDYTKEIYKDAELSEFSVQRNISCKADKRTKALEVLALYR
jgi:DNA adenine methylase